MVGDEGLEKWTALEDRVRVVEGNHLYDPMKATKMCLVPNVVIPKKFRVPEFVKYTGTQCPVTHLKAYCKKKKTEVVYDEKLLIHFFQDSLSDVTLTWYMWLDNTKVKKWKDLVMPSLGNKSSTWMWTLICQACKLWKRKTRSS
jgi:hypothetical protein